MTMPILYRIMVTGEDGLEFCYDDEIKPTQLVDTIKEVGAQYPCADIHVERHEKVEGW